MIFMIMMLEIHGATDLSGLKNSEIPFFVVSLWGRVIVLFTDISSLVMCTGWYMDPFIVISFGK